MKIRALISISFLLVSGAVSAQHSTDKSIKISSLRYPRFVASGPTTYQILIHNGSIPVETSSLIKKRGLVSRLQKAQDDTIGTVEEFYTYFPYTAAQSHPDLLIEIGFGNYVTGTPVLKEHKISCTIKGQKVSKETIHECPAYYYEWNYKLPYALRMIDKFGKVVFTESFPGEGIQTFGFDGSGLSGHLRKDQLEKAYNTQQLKQPMLMASGALTQQLDQLEDNLQSLCFYTIHSNKLSIASASGNGFNYAALDLAQKQTIDAFAKLKRETSPLILTDLASTVATWKKEIANLNMNDDSSRINRKVAVGLYSNLALVYTYSWHLDSAEVYIAKAQNLVKYSDSLTRQEEITMIAMEIKNRRDRLSAFQAHSNQKNDLIKAPVLLDAIRAKSRDIPYSPITGKSLYAQWAVPTASKRAL